MWYLLFGCDNWPRSPEISLRDLRSGILLDKKVTRGIGSWSYPSAIIGELVGKKNAVEKVNSWS
jgi:hypothetical protein